MNIQLSKILNIRLGLNLILLVFLIFELYLGFTYLYRNLDPQPQNVTSNNIIRVNRETFKQVTAFLKDQDDFTPPVNNLSNPNPFNLKP